MFKKAGRSKLNWEVLSDVQLVRIQCAWMPGVGQDASQTHAREGDAKLNTIT